MRVVRRMAVLYFCQRAAAGQEQDKIEKELEDVVRHSKTRQGRDGMSDQERNRQDKAYQEHI